MKKKPKVTFRVHGYYWEKFKAACEEICVSPKDRLRQLVVEECGRATPEVTDKDMEALRATQDDGR